MESTAMIYLQSVNRLAMIIIFLIVDMGAALAHTDDMGALIQIERSTSSAEAQRVKVLADSQALAWHTTPNTIPIDFQGSVKIELFMQAGTFTGVPSLSVTGGANYPFNDSGLDGDALAGDSIWTLSIPNSILRNGLASSDLMRRDVGTVDFVAQGVTNRYNFSVKFHTPAIGSVPIARVSNTWQHTGHVANLVAPDLIAQIRRDKSFASLSTITQRAFALMPRSFDFVAVAFDRSFSDNRFFVSNVNAVQGIGLAARSTDSYGGGTGLQGVIVLPSHNFIDHANHGFVHEIGHRWLAFASAPAGLGSGVPHWPASTMGTGVMGVSIPPTGAGGNFNCQFSLTTSGLALSLPSTIVLGRKFGPLDLYLMGLAEPAEVPEQFVVPSAGSGNCTPGVLTSGYNRFTVGDYISANGPRLPAAASAQRNFKLATIVVSEEMLSAETMAYFDLMARRAGEQIAVPTHEGLARYDAAPFYLATERRAKIDPVMNAALVTTPTVQVFEFYNAGLDRYFYTADASEATYLRNTPATGERDTGFGFKGYSTLISSPSAALVCRFYGSVSPGPNSHFYTADPGECSFLKSLQASTPANQKRWNYEANAYRIELPSGQTCAAGLVPIYRAYNRGDARGRDSNHRLVSNQAEYQKMITQGWAGEGVVMCGAS